ncbi:MAG: S-layer homology domain-containing protein [Clostridiales bacterium]|nr:S-layer homology domain-containing protein [Clostridiales bacterium]
MSKQPKKSTIRNWLRRGLSGILSLALILALLPGTVLPVQAAHWAMPYAQKLVEWGVMRGDNGNLALERPITRAEFVAMMNRAYGYKKLGEMPFPDVRTYDWYYQDINIAYNMGYFKGASGYALPKANLTREMAAVLLTRNMMLQENVGEGLQFSDSRSLSEWSRGLVGAAADMGIIGGYADGSFKPKQNITRGEVASMLVKAIGTMVNTEGEHTLGDVYGNVTVNTAGVTLRNGTIAGNLYLTGGIDLGDVVLENVNVLGEIIVSGGGESHSSQSSVTLRNVTAKSMSVDSISNQFVTLRAEGITDIGTTTVRTNAYVDDSSLPGFNGLGLIIQDGGSLLQLAGNVKEVWNKTPNSELQVVQGSANKITMDEHATNSSVLVDGDARVDSLNLDVATKVTGEGDIKNLNVGAAGTTVEQLPDDITIRPGITSDIKGSTMNSVQAAESSADPRLLAGYPKVKNIAPNSAELVFSANKAGTVYWALTAVSDGSVSEADLIEPPTYGGRILKSGSIKITSSKTEFKAPNLTGLTQAGSYYVSAVFVDDRGVHSPVKVTAFTTPDGTTPAFSDGPRMSRITTEVAQVTGMPNKSCLLYYALLPKGATAPTTAELKANAVRGNLGYGVRDAVKNSNITINVNDRQLDQETDYVVYLWLTDYDGSKSSRVYSVPFKTPDERSPVIISTRPGGADETAIEMNFTVDEACTLFWTIIPEGRETEIAFEGLENEDDYKPNGLADPEDRALQMKIENGAGKYTKNGKKSVSAANANKEILIALNETRKLDSTITGTSTYVMYMVAKDAAGNYSKIEKVIVKTRDNTPPKFVRQEFTAIDSGSKEPKPDTDIKLVFSENIKGGSGADKVFLKLYEAVLDAAKASQATGGGQSEVEAEAAARNRLAAALRDHIRLYRGQTGQRPEDLVTDCCTCYAEPDGTGNFHIVTKYKGTLDTEDDDWIINYCFAKVEMTDGSLIVTFPTVENSDGTVNKNASALNLASGATYHFVLSGIRDNSEEANRLDPDPTEVPYFTTEFAKVNLTAGEALFLDERNPEDSGRIDFHFIADPQGAEGVEEDQYWDMMIWANTSMGFTLYSRPKGGTDAQWVSEGSAEIRVPSTAEFVYTSLFKIINGNSTNPSFEQVNKMKGKEYAIHIDWLEDMSNTTASKWNKTVKVQVSMVCGTRNHLIILPSAGTSLDGETVISIPKPFELSYPFKIKDAPDIQSVSITSKYDTSVDISVDLGDTAGQVYYMYFPLNTLRNASSQTVGGDNITLTEDMIQNQVASYGADYTVKVNISDTTGILPKDVPVMSLDSALSELPAPLTGKKEVAQPSVNTVTSAAAVRGVIKGHTDKVEPGSPANFSLTNLSANKVYYLCLVTRGDSDDPNAFSTSAVVYRFTTQRAARPLLNLSGSGSVVNVESDRKGTLDYFLASYSYEDAAFRRAFSNSDTYKYATSTFGSATDTYSYEGKGQAMNVLTAMATPCYDNNNNYVGSVFDIFATDSAKSFYASQISSQQVKTGQIIETGKSKPMAATPEGTAIPTSNVYNYTNKADVKAGTNYIFVAVAQGDKGSGYSFRALYPVTKTDLTPPMITSSKLEVNPADFDKVNGVISKGTLTLTFSEPLYAVATVDGRQTSFQICNCMYLGHSTTESNPIGANAAEVKDRYWGVGYLAASTLQNKLKIVGASSHANGKLEAPVQSIVLSVTNVTTGGLGEGTLSFDRADICDDVGNGISRTPLVVTVRLVNKGTAADPNWDYVIDIPKVWDART